MFEEMRSKFVVGLMTVAGIMSISLLLQATGNFLLNSVVMLLVFYIILPVWICSYFFKRHGLSLRQVISFRGTARWLLPLAGLTVLVIGFSISIYWLLLRGLLPISPTLVEIALTPQPLPDEFWYLVATGLIIALIAPIAEELIFRGVILNWLMGTFGLWKGIGLTSLLFGIFHINIFGAFLFAVVASLLYVKTGNLLMPILLHIFNNTISVYQSLINPTFPEWLMVTNINDVYTKAGANLVVLLASLVLLLIVIWWLGRGLEVGANKNQRRTE